MRSLRSHLGIVTAALLACHPFAFGAPALMAQGTAAATSLAMDGRGSASTHVVKIGVLSVSTTAAAGLTLSVRSGSLTKADGSTPVAFQVVLVDRDAAAPSSAAFMTPSGMIYTFATSSAVTVEKDLYIKYTPVPLQDPGSYTASVDLDVVDN
ncbi:MAG: hypothetical protein JWP01_1001 [Myxococcales bacterium]|nr:hypothetical protein [Myxococcales bacterium]